VARVARVAGEDTPVATIATTANGGPPGFRNLSTLQRLKLTSWLPHVMVGTLAVPFLIHQNAWYEWANSLWLLELQAAHVSAYGIPSFFIHGADMIFYPQFLFYAGPAFSFLAYPAVVFGSWPVFAAVTVAAFIAASAGMSWTARNLGVPRGLAILPGILFATTPYIVSNLYGRGAWAELVAIGALAVSLGAATSLLTGRARSEAGMVAVLAVAVAAIAGTHNLTLLFSALLAPLLGLALLPILRGSRRQLLRRYALVIAGAVLGLALCGAFLVPNVWLSGRTFTSNTSNNYLVMATGFDRLGVVFDPLPGQPAGSPPSDLHTQTLVVALLWAVGATAFALSRRWLDRRSQLALALLGLVGIGVAVLIGNPGWWLSFPATLRAVQFPFRLVTYLALLTVLAIVVLLAIPALRRSRVAIALLALASVWQIGVALDLAISAKARNQTPAPTSASIHPWQLPPAFVAGSQLLEFRLVSKHPLSTPPAVAGVSPLGYDSPPQVELSGSEPVGTLVATRVVASPLIRFSGDASVAGATEEGMVVLRVNQSPWQVTVGSVCNTCLRALTGEAPFALLAGRVLSVVGLFALLGLIVAAIPRNRGRVRARDAR
jgi:hypothetical protein